MSSKRTNRGGNGGGRGSGGHGRGSGRKRPVFGSHEDRSPRPRGENATPAVPHIIEPLKFAAARANEIRAMVQGIAAKNGMKRAHQVLPRHMRRRAMSYNVKRLPVRLRARGAMEMASTLTPAEKSKGKRQRYL